VETRAAFRLQGFTGLTAAAVTQRLGVQPTKEFEEGSAFSRRSASTRDSSLWILSSSPQVEIQAEPREHLHRLLAVLEPVAERLWDVVDAGYVANWCCWVASHATEHAVELDRPTLQRILALPGDLWLDVCGDGSDD
jgi:hypothetical protein